MHRLLTLILIAAAAAGCDARAKHQAVAADATDGPAITLPKDGGLIPGTPEGDLGDWVQDIRAGIADVPELAARDAGEAQRKTLDLYVARQEYAEMYYGVDGRNQATAELSEAVETAEERFHALMQLLAKPNPSIDALKTAVAALDEQQAVVAQLWRQSGVTLDRSAP
ncbi:MAG: hypothetical protein ACT443_01305 [Gemmatimonadota bacterium]